MTSVVVYTALFGDPRRDDLAPPPAGETAPCLCFSDAAPRSRAPGWEIVHTPLEPGGNPVLTARLCKLRPDLYVGAAVTTVWHDASIRLLQPSATLVALSTAPVMGLRHPRRTCLQDEAHVIIQHRLAPRAAVERQMASYQGAGYPIRERPVTTTGFLVRTPEAASFNQRWEVELRAHTWRDQLSVDYAAWATDTAIGWHHGSYLENAFMHYQHHAGYQVRRRR